MQRRKIAAVLLLSVFVCFLLPAAATAAESAPAQDPAQAYFSEAWNVLDDETASLLDALGVSADEMDSLFRLEPENILQMVKRLFSASFQEIRGDLAVTVLILALSCVFLRMVAPGANREFASVVAASSVVFLLTAASAQMADRCVSAIVLTADFVKGLLPVYAGVIAFSGNPGMALETQTLIFAYAETVCAWFSAAVPAFSAFSAALSVAAALRPGEWPDVLPGLVQKAVRFVMGFLAGIFSAVLAVRGMLAEAADTVTVRGARFLIGSMIPAVGGAVGDALASVQAGISMAKTGVGILGVIAVALISLPALCTLVLWRAALFAAGAAAELFGDARSAKFTKSLGELFGTLGAALVFDGVVYIAALGLVLRAKGGG